MLLRFCVTSRPQDSMIRSELQRHAWWKLVLCDAVVPSALLTPTPQPITLLQIWSLCNMGTTHDVRVGSSCRQSCPCATNCHAITSRPLSPCTPPLRSCTFSAASVRLGMQGLQKRGIQAWTPPQHLMGRLYSSKCSNQAVLTPGPGLPGPLYPSSASIMADIKADSGTPTRQAPAPGMSDMLSEKR